MSDKLSNDFKFKKSRSGHKIGHSSGSERADSKAVNSQFQDKSGKKNKKKRIYEEVKKTPEEIEALKKEKVRKKRKKHEDKVCRLMFCLWLIRPRHLMIIDSISKIFNNYI